MEGIGILFEGLHPTTTRGFLWESFDSNHGNAESNVVPATSKIDASFEWERRPMIQTQEHNNSARNKTKNNRVICAVVRCIDDHPGAVASGHYVWPSSLVLCDYLVAAAATCLHHPKSVLELGSGCSGIASMVASQVFVPKMVVVTDHDLTALERARENHQATMLETQQQKQQLGADGHVRTEFVHLEWGSPSDWQALQECLGKNKNSKHEMMEQPKQTQERQSQYYFDLVLGSDLIESTEVVEPLFSTVHAALQSNSNTSTSTTKTGGLFLMAQSFAYDSETEAAINRACDRFGLVRRVVLHQKEESGSQHGGVSCDSGTFIKIQEFKRRE